MFVLPVNRDAPVAGNSLVTKILIAVNSLIWSGLTLAGLNLQAIREFGLQPAHWTFATAFSHMFLHAGLWQPAEFAPGHVLCCRLFAYPCVRYAPCLECVGPRAKDATL